MIPILSISFFLFSLFIISFTFSPCCDRVGGSCGLVCKQISLMTLVTSEKDEGRLLLASLQTQFHLQCPQSLMSFWNCINETLHLLEEGRSWEGHICCPLVITHPCQYSCLTASDVSDLIPNCRRSDESVLYHCLHQLNMIESCCGESNRPDCVSTCQSILRKSSSLQSHDLIRRSLVNVCGLDSTVVSCVLNQTLLANSPLPNPIKFLSCCQYGRNPTCQLGCSNMLGHHNQSQSVLLNGLISSDCGHPRPDDKMWGCFLQNVEPSVASNYHLTPSSQITRLGMDATKLHCCSRAIGETCRRLCFNTYSHQWSDSWTDLDSICLSSSDQLQLRTCVDDVDEPCQLGCNDLSFCSEFNGRSSELFRRCNSIGDRGANETFFKWIKNGYISLSDTYRLPLRNDSDCDWHKWKSIACVLELKPCHPETHVMQICQPDCLSLLHECLDFDTFMSNGNLEGISNICNSLSPPIGNPCISLAKYKIPTLKPSIKIHRPCELNPCNTSEVCIPNRDKCPNDNRNCLPYICKSGCQLGEVSKVVVEIGTWLRLPMNPNNYECVRLCQCGSNALVSNGVHSICESLLPCWLKRTRIDHGSSFWIDCNICSCRSGEIYCSKNICNLNQPRTSDISRRYPCNCPPIFSPVCGSNGKTYSSNCIARCSGLRDGEMRKGNCADVDPCEGVYCGSGHRCIPFRRTCLHPYPRRCPQYQCVPFKCQMKDIICDTFGREHDNLCEMINSNGIFNYRGHCRNPLSCSSEGQICGVDGTTYDSECAGERREIPKDYIGPCLSDVERICEDVHCETECKHGIVPPGACCPMCGGVLRIIYNWKGVIALANGIDASSVTIDELIYKLAAHIGTLECRVGLYLSHGSEVVVLIRPAYKPFSPTLLDTCRAESHRLASLITQQSPLFKIDGVLNLLIEADSSLLSNSCSDFKLSWTLFKIILISILINYLI